MSRYLRQFPIQNIDLNFVSSEIGRYMTSEGFSLVPYKGQTVWSKGVWLFYRPAVPDNVLLLQYDSIGGIY
jgi:hypothetical protein